MSRGRAGAPARLLRLALSSDDLSRDDGCCSPRGEQQTVPCLPRKAGGAFGGAGIHVPSAKRVGRMIARAAEQWCRPVGPRRRGRDRKRSALMLRLHGGRFGPQLSDRDRASWVSVLDRSLARSSVYWAAAMGGRGRLHLDHNQAEKPSATSETTRRIHSIGAAALACTPPGGGMYDALGVPK